MTEQNNQTDEARKAAAATGQKEQNVNVSSDDHRVCKQMPDVSPGSADLRDMFGQVRKYGCLHAISHC